MPFDPEWERVHQQVSWGTVYDPDLHRFIVERFSDGRDRSTMTVLDLGCGAGANSVPLARDGFNVIAVDGSATAIGRLTARVADQPMPLKAYVADVTSLSVEPASIDICVDVCTLQQMTISDARKCISDALGWLKPDGLFFSKMARAPFPAYLNRTSYIRMATPESIRELFEGYNYAARAVSFILSKNKPPETIHHYVIEARKQ